MNAIVHHVLCRPRRDLPPWQRIRGRLAEPLEHGVGGDAHGVRDPSAIAQQSRHDRHGVTVGDGKNVAFCPSSRLEIAASSWRSSTPGRMIARRSCAARSSSQPRKVVTGTGCGNIKTDRVSASVRSAGQVPRNFGGALVVKGVDAFAKSSECAGGCSNGLPARSRSKASHLRYR